MLVATGTGRYTLKVASFLVMGITILACSMDSKRTNRRVNSVAATADANASSDAKLDPSSSTQSELEDKPTTEDQTPGPEPLVSVVRSTPLSCKKPPTLKVLSTQPWEAEVHGANDQYTNFFTPIVHFKGYTYWVWVDRSYVPYVSKFDSNGKATTARLADGYKTRPNSHNSLFSLGIDPKGYLHIVGDMQNGPNDREDDYPTEFRSAPILYWKSKNPEDITSGFDFLGKKAEAIPADAVNGIRFFTDNFGVLYASAAVNANNQGHYAGEKGIGLYRYDTSALAWEAIGGENPKTTAEKDGTVKDVKKYRILFWEEGGTGGWFQGSFGTFRFDAANRLHFAAAINSNTQLSGHDRLVYAVYSDGSWQKANGEKITSLPVRAADGVPGQGDLVQLASGKNLFNWQVNVVPDRNGRPGLWVKLGESDAWYAYDGKKWRTDSNVAQEANIPEVGLVAPGGTALLVRSQSPKVHCYPEGFFQEAAASYALEGYSRFINTDEYGLKTVGSLLGIAVKESDGTRSLVRLDYE